MLYSEADFGLLADFLSSRNYPKPSPKSKRSVAECTGNSRRRMFFSF
jgi:hypothetical protein